MANPASKSHWARLLNQSGQLHAGRRTKLKAALVFVGMLFFGTFLIPLFHGATKETVKETSLEEWRQIITVAWTQDKQALAKLDVSGEYTLDGLMQWLGSLPPEQAYGPSHPIRRMAGRFRH